MNVKNNNLAKHDLRGRGLYVYGITMKGSSYVFTGNKPVCFGEDIMIIPFDDLEAIASYVDFAVVNRELLQEKLRSDLLWTKQNVQRHHEVIARVMEMKSAVIPFTFGTIFKTKQRFLEQIQKKYDVFKQLIVSLQEKGEWGIKVYVDGGQYRQYCMKNDPDLRQLTNRKQSASDGIKWYLDRKIDELMSLRGEGEIKDICASVVKDIEPVVNKVVVNEPFLDELSGRREEMILNAACLVDKGNVRVFYKTLGQLLGRYKKQGIVYEVTGPWPPYNFVPHYETI